jgi:light-regulated signal transduction histidine kinase (bacteriophytochrome)
MDISVRSSRFGTILVAALCAQAGGAFAQEAQARQIRGSGLGLSLVSRIVEAHSGRITLTSTPGQGSTFVVSLPASFAGPDESPLAPEEFRGTAHPAG